MHKKYMLEDSSLSNKTEVCCVHGDCNLYPVKDVHTQIGRKGGGFSDCLPFAVSSGLPVDVILGTSFPRFNELCTQHFGNKKPNIIVLVGTRKKNYSPEELKQDEYVPRMIDWPPMPSIPDSPSPKDGGVDLPENGIKTIKTDPGKAERPDRRKQSRKERCIELDLYKPV
jgi:hypothetical protein